jgi:hypothetical protein
MNLSIRLPVIVSGVLATGLCLGQSSELSADESFVSLSDQEPAELRVEGDLDVAPTYEEIAGIIASNCLSCHGASRPRKGVRLDTEAFARQFASRASQEILDGTMPPRKPGFGKSPEGQRLLEWFSQTP